MPHYISHARTAEQLRQEVISDLNRRIDLLVRQREAFGRGVAGKARFNGRIDELEDMLRYWTAVQLTPKTKET